MNNVILALQHMIINHIHIVIFTSKYQSVLLNN